SGGNSRVLVEFYSGILRRLQDAADEGDVALLDGLVDSYDRPNVPEAFRQHLEGYRAIARGIGFQHHVSQNATLRLRGDGPDGAEPQTPVLGQPLQLELVLPPMATPVRLGALGERDPIGFSVSVTIDDEFVDGSSRLSRSREFLWLPQPVELAGDDALTLPVDVGADAGDAVRRSVLVRIDLMPGYVTFGDVRAPVQRVTAGASSYTQWPKGHEILRAQPMAGLRAALKDFTPKNYASAYLSAVLVPARQRDEACALLIDQVRFGRADQAQVAMAALQEIAGVKIAVGDRDGWLAWWQSRQ
ncbi:MAG: hypothetical protein KAI24_11815, partial [Planctomycetes bacterium]|nr:hypothetical protein [Planctomycetota bacterium]